MLESYFRNQLWELFNQEKEFGIYMEAAGWHQFLIIWHWWNQLLRGLVLWLGALATRPVPSDSSFLIH